MERLFTYVARDRRHAGAGAVKRLPMNSSPWDIFRTTLEHEYHITKCIQRSGPIAFTTGITPFNFLVVCGRAARRGEAVQKHRRPS